MFGKRQPSLVGEMNVSDQSSLLVGSSEFVRLWAKQDGPVTCLIDPTIVGPDPFLFGIAIMDCIRHGAKAYAQAVSVPEEHALQRILEGVDAERANPTDTPQQIISGTTLQ